LVTIAAATGCGRELTGPRGTRPGAVQLSPAFPSLRLPGASQPLSVGSIVSFVRVRIVLLRANGDTVLHRVINFPADSASISLSFPVTLDAAAPATGEVLAATLRFIDATGDTVFRGGPINVVATPPNIPAPPTPEIPLTYTGTGSNAASLTITPRSASVRNGDLIAFTAIALDAQGGTLPGTPVAYSSLDTSRVRVGLSSGSATVTGFRGTAIVLVQTVTGQRDSAVVSIIPTPTAITIVSGNNQETNQRRPFPNPIRVRVAGGDGLPVAGQIVAFTVTAGQGSLSQIRDTTDADGLAEVIWTAGPTTGAASLRAEVLGAPTSVAVTVSGTQLAPLPPSQLRFVQQPVGFVAGAVPTLNVVLLDAAGDTARSYTGPIRMTLAAGPTGAVLSGTVTVSAVNGRATFSGLRAELAGPGYRLTARADSISGLVSAPTDTFTVRPGPTVGLSILTAPAGASNGSAFTTQPIVTAIDAFGNRTGEGGLLVTAAIASGTGRLGGTLTRTTASGSGSATFADLGITGAGTHALRFTSSSLTATSATFPIAAAAPGIRLHVGASDRTGGVIGTDLAIPLLVDLTNRGGLDLASMTVTVTWDTTQFTYIGNTTGAWTDDAGGAGSIFVNTANTTAGRLVISGFTANPTTGSFLLRTLTLRPRTSGTATLNATAGPSGNAAGGAVPLVVRSLTVTTPAVP
jgi:hypothetical protein